MVKQQSWSHCVVPWSFLQRLRSSGVLLLLEVLLSAAIVTIHGTIVCVLVFEAIFEVAFNAVVLYAASSLLSCVSVRPPLLCRREGRRSDGRALLMGKKARDGAKISPKPSLLGRELEYIYNILVYTTFHGKSAKKV